MTARLVHAVLAAGVHNPELISRWREDPSLLAKYGINPDSIDLERLWKFSGLATKVRHNGTRSDLPMTYRLMSFLGMEIELFASYATWCAENHRYFAKTTHQRTSDLIAFMEGWLDFGNQGQCLVWDLIRHEHALSSLRGLDPGPPPPPGPKAFLTSTVPRVNGKVMLHSFLFDPGEITGTLSSDRSKLDSLQAGMRYFCYWLPGKAVAIQVLELDEFGYYFIASVDGVKSVDNIREEFDVGIGQSDDFLHLAAQLGELGILTNDTITGKEAS